MKHKIISARERISYFFGDEVNFGIEHRLFNVTSSIVGLTGILTILINLIVDAPINLTLVSSSVTLFSWGIFYISRFRNRFELSKWLMTVTFFLLFIFIYFINNGSKGPMLLLYLVFFLLLLFIWTGKARLFFISIFVLNIVIYFVIELKYPDVFKPYNTERARVIDVYLSFFLYAVIGAVILMFAKKGYQKEKIKAEKSDKLKSAFLANMSHEIRTPMNAILGFSQLLQKEGLSREKKETYIHVIQENSHSLLRLIEDIIDVSKIEAGELEIKEVEVNLKNLISKLAATFRLLLNDHPEKNISIIEVIPPLKVYVIADNTRLKQVLTNLLSNAYKYTDEGTIVIGFTQEEGYLKFFVRDSGVGIREDDVINIFDRFRKIENQQSYKIQPGTGIGLSISKNLVRLMGGELKVKSEFGKGSEFFFTIPFVPSLLEIPDESETTSIRESPRPVLYGKVVLVVEDDKTNSEFLRKVLSRVGAEIYHASDGKQAVDIIMNNKNIDLVLMDIMMPVMNGYEASRIIKGIDPAMPILAQTALAMEGDAEKVLASGCDDYISKPIRINELISKLKKLTEKE